jgi:N-acetylglucosamine kinase-like BadF-type ATPase
MSFTAEQEAITAKFAKERAARNVLRGFAKALKEDGMTPVQVLAAFAVIAGEIATQEV